LIKIEIKENAMSTTPDTLTQKPSTPADDEDNIEKELLADGVLDLVPPPTTDGTVYHQWQPIPWQGKPVSETILEERR
jgi:hypothetical protein